MSAVAPALIAAGAGVGLGHAVMPDHWVPLAVVGRTKRYSVSRVTRLATLAGIAHVLVSILLGAVIVVIGLQFRSSIESAQDTIVGGLLLATGIAFVALELSGRGHQHGPGGHTHAGGHGHAHDHDHTHDHDQTHSGGHGLAHDHDQTHSGGHGLAHDHDQTHSGGHGLAHDHAGAGSLERRGGLLAVMIPFGAAASPDLTILPVFLAAAAVSVAAAIGTLIVFALTTIATIVGLTVAAFLTGYKFEGNWLDRWGNVVTAGVLLVIGALVITHII